MNLAGALVAAVTPFDPVTGEVDVVGMRSNIRWWIERDALGIVIGGSTGEAVYLDEDERRVLLEAARGVIPAAAGPPATRSGSRARAPSPRAPRSGSARWRRTWVRTRCS